MRGGRIGRQRICGGWPMSCAPPRVFQEYVRAVSEQSERLPRLEGERQPLAQSWRWAPGVEALQARRGIQFTPRPSPGSPNWAT
jgi:hypothetical protein